jgi:hypothetical protein
LQARRAKGSKLAGHMEPSGIDVLHALLAANGDVGGDAQALESAGDKMWLLLARATKVVQQGGGRWPWPTWIALAAVPLVIDRDSV